MIHTGQSWIIVFESDLDRKENNQGSFSEIRVEHCSNISSEKERINRMDFSYTARR